MQSVQKMGGIGALIAAGTFVVGLAMFATLFTDFVSAATPAAAVEFIADNQLALHLWNITIMIVFGIVLVPLVLAIGDRLREAHSPLARVASVFGLIWSGVIISTGMITNIAYATVSDLQGTDPEMASHGVGWSRRGDQRPRWGQRSPRWRLGAGNQHRCSP